MNLPHPIRLCIYNWIKWSFQFGFGVLLSADLDISVNVL
jgi:hypothetical protein